MLSSRTCQLCYEADLSTSDKAMTLSACGHRGCKACLARWIEREESTGQNTPPACPFCRFAIDGDDVSAVLGRPLRPRVEFEPGDDASGGEADELTLQWLNERTVRCGGCGARVEKTGGCNSMQCLCGWRFCYECGTARGGCECSHGQRFQNVQDAPVRDGGGQINLRACMRRSRVRPLRERARNRRMTEVSSRWMHSEKNASVCTANGRWLFSSTDSRGCIKMLTQQLGYAKTYRDRQRSAKQKRAEEMGAWNLRSETQVSVMVANGRWLFSPAKYAGSIRMLTQQLNHEKVSGGRRLQRRMILSGNNAAHDNSWLFLNQGHDLKGLLKEMQQHFPVAKKIGRRGLPGSRQSNRKDAANAPTPEQYFVRIPDEVTAGERFIINVNGRKLSVTHHTATRPGSFVRVSVRPPPESGTYTTKVPKGVKAGEKFTTMIDGRQVRVTCPSRIPLLRKMKFTLSQNVEDKQRSDEAQLFQVTVPEGCEPGQEFPLLAGGLRLTVRCPPNANGGQRIRFRLPVWFKAGFVRAGVGNECS